METPPPHLFALTKSEQRVVLVILLALLAWPMAALFHRRQGDQLGPPATTAATPAIPLDEETAPDTR